MTTGKTINRQIMYRERRQIAGVFVGAFRAAPDALGV
jgi:hypothetical protein